MKQHFIVKQTKVKSNMATGQFSLSVCNCITEDNDKQMREYLNLLFLFQCYLHLVQRKNVTFFPAVCLVIPFCVWEIEKKKKNGLDV